MSRVLCRLDEIEDRGAKGFDLAEGQPGIFVVRLGDAVYGYVNDCPHWRISLDFVPGRFMNLERTMILCSNHGARFNIADGRCTWGPCRGERLRPVPVRVHDGCVILDAAAAEADNPS